MTCHAMDVRNACWKPLSSSGGQVKFFFSLCIQRALLTLRDPVAFLLPASLAYLDFQYHCAWYSRSQLEITSILPPKPILLSYFYFIFNCYYLSARHNFLFQFIFNCDRLFQFIFDCNHLHLRPRLHLRLYSYLSILHSNHYYLYRAFRSWLYNYVRHHNAIAS